MRIKKSASRFGSINLRGFIGFGFCLIAVVLAMLGVGLYSSRAALAPPSGPKAQQNRVMVVHSIHNDISVPLRDMFVISPAQSKREPSAATGIPRIPHHHRDGAEPATPELARNRLPSFLADPILNFSGIPYSGVIPPDPSGAAGATQYVQMVNL